MELAGWMMAAAGSSDGRDGFNFGGVFIPTMVAVVVVLLAIRAWNNRKSK